MKKKTIHTIQGITLVIAALMLWIPLEKIGLSHMASMGIVTAIVGVNALIELLT